MSYNDDSVRAKLSALNETQESIVTVAQWVMFHKRYADRTAQLWIQRLKESNSPKRLNLIYLANEVIQQSKARKKDDFLLAFTPVMAEAISVAAKGANNDILHKLRRNVEVWRQRTIFDEQTQVAIEGSLDEIDKPTTRAPAKKPLLGGSLFQDTTTAIPQELQSIVASQNALSKASLTTQPLVAQSATGYAALIDGARDGTHPVPTPPAYAAQLNALIKTLASAEDAVAEKLKIRKALIDGLEKLIKANAAELAAETDQHMEINAWHIVTKNKREEVEDSIMHGLPQSNDHLSATATVALTNVAAHDEVDRPEVERFTPPPIDSTTPPGMPPSAHLDGADEFETPEYEELTPPPIAPPPAPPAETTFTEPAFTNDPRRRPMTDTRVRQHSDPSSPVNGVKRRKMSGQGGEYYGFVEGGNAMDGLDDDVVGMLG